jgi:hypothetical protein
MILYPAGLNIFLIILISLLFILYLFIAIKKRRITVLKMIVGIFIFLITLAIIIGFAWLLQRGLIKKYPHYTLHYYWNFYNIKHYIAAFSAFSVAIFAFVYTLLNKKPGLDSLFAGFLFISFIVIFALQKFFPTGTYLFIVPMFFILISTIICYLFNFDIQKSKGIFYTVHLLLLIPVISLFVPLIKLFFIVFGLKLIFAGVALTVILSGFLLMLFKAFIEYKKWLLAIVALLTGIVFLISGHITSKYSEKQPLLSNVMYCLNSNTTKAYWVSENLRTDEWNKQFFTQADTAALTEIYPFSEKLRLLNQAPVLDLAKPEIFIESDSVFSENRKVELCLKSNREAHYVEIYIHKDAKLNSLRINNKPVTLKEFYDTGATNYYTIYYFGLYEQGCRLSLDCKSIDTFELFVAEKKMGLPLPDGFKPKPGYVISDKDYNSNLSLVKYSWML